MMACLDIFVTNGHVTDNVQLYDPQLSYRQTDLLYENIGGGRFRNVSAESGPAFRIQHVGRGAAVGDFDNDGDLDIVIADCGGPPLLLRNDGGNRNHWLGDSRPRPREQSLRDRLEGTGDRGRPHPVPRDQSVRQLPEHQRRPAVRRAGVRDQASRVEIEWPSSKKQVLEHVPADQTLLLDEANAAR